MTTCFGLCLIAMAIITALKPLPQPIEFKTQTDLNLASSGGAKIAGIVVIVITLALYVRIRTTG